MYKILSSSFTTPYQSKRLLELGVPADSADLYTSLGFENLIWIRTTKNELSEDFFDALINGKSAHIPIWSVGRLIEIFSKCKMYGEENKRIPLKFYADEINGGFVEFLIEVMYNYNDFDFSKLEE